MAITRRADARAVDVAVVVAGIGAGADEDSEFKADFTNIEWQEVKNT
jgi:hypothetical protein